MINGSILFGLAILIVVVLYLARPFFIARRRPAVNLSRKQQLEAEKDGLLFQIRALDFDHETGKIPTEEYEIQRAELMAQATAKLKEIDQLTVGDEQDIYLQIEAAISDMRRQRDMAGVGQVAYCPNCGRPLDAGDNFCAGCGQPVVKAELTY